MPRVPITTVRPQGPPGGGRFSAPGVAPVQSAAGQQIQQAGAAMLRAGGAAVSIGNHLQQQFDLARAKEADNLASDVFRTEMLSYLQTQGKDATGERRSQAFDTIRERLDEIGQSLGTPAQRAMFREKADQRMEDALYKADKHEAQQVLVYEMAESDARATAFLHDAVEADPETDEFDVYRGSMLAELDGIADKMGFEKDSAQRAALKLEKTTALHAGVIDRMLYGQNVAAAREHLAAYGAEVDPKAKQLIEKTIKTAGVKDRAQRLHQDMMQQELPPLQILHAANALFEGGELNVEERDELMSRVARHEDFVSSMKARAATQALEAAKTTLLQGGELSAQDLTRLGTLGVLDQLKTWRAQGLTHKTSDAGFLFKQQARDNAEQLFENFRDEKGEPSWPVAYRFLRNELDDTDLDVVHEYWRQWRGLEPQDPVAIDVDLMLLQALRDIGPDAGGLAPTFARGTPTPDERAVMDKFKADVTRDVIAHVRGRKAVLKDYDDAIARIRRNALRASGAMVPAKTATQGQLGDDDNVWVTEFGELPVTHAYMHPSSDVYKTVARQLATEKGGVENVYDIDIATEVQRLIVEHNEQNQQLRYTNIERGTQFLQHLYSSKLSRAMQNIVNQREQMRQQLVEADQPTTGIPYEDTMPSASQFHEGLRDEILNAWGEKLAVQYGLTEEQMRAILDKAGNYQVPQTISEVFETFPVLRPGARNK